MRGKGQGEEQNVAKGFRPPNRDIVVPYVMTYVKDRTPPPPNFQKERNMREKERSD